MDLCRGISGRKRAFWKRVSLRKLKGTSEILQTFLVFFFLVLKDFPKHKVVEGAGVSHLFLHPFFSTILLQRQMGSWVCCGSPCPEDSGGIECNDAHALDGFSCSQVVSQDWSKQNLLKSQRFPKPQNEAQAGPNQSLKYTAEDLKGDRGKDVLWWPEAPLKQIRWGKTLFRHESGLEWGFGWGFAGCEVVFF